MNKLLTLAALGLALSFGAAHAADSKKTPQQEKMAACNKDATGKKGDERKAFMKTCLSAKKDATATAAAAPAPAAAPTAKAAQQSKMKACNTDAGDKKGADRKKFMSECLKKAA